MQVLFRPLSPPLSLPFSPPLASLGESRRISAESRRISGESRRISASCGPCARAPRRPPRPPPETESRRAYQPRRREFAENSPRLTQGSKGKDKKGESRVIKFIPPASTEKRSPR